MIAERNPQMRKAVGILKELSADERTRMLLEENEIIRRDIASREKEQGVRVNIISLLILPENYSNEIDRLRKLSRIPV